VAQRGDIAAHEENTLPLPWPLGSAPRQMKAGARITGEFSVCLLCGQPTSKFLLADS